MSVDLFHFLVTWLGLAGWDFVGSFRFALDCLTGGGRIETRSFILSQLQLLFILLLLLLWLATGIAVSRSVV